MTRPSGASTAMSWCVLHRFLLVQHTPKTFFQPLLSSVLDNRGPLTSIENPFPYLFRAILNESKNHRRRLRPPPLLREDIDVAEPRPDVVNAVSRLPRRQRAAVYLTYCLLEGLACY